MQDHGGLARRLLGLVAEGVDGRRQLGEGARRIDLYAVDVHWDSYSFHYQETRAISMVDPGPMVINTPYSPGAVTPSARRRS